MVARHDLDLAVRVAFLDLLLPFERLHVWVEATRLWLFQVHEAGEGLLRFPVLQVYFRLEAYFELFVTLVMINLGFPSIVIPLGDRLCARAGVSPGAYLQFLVSTLSLQLEVLEDLPRLLYWMPRFLVLRLQLTPWLLGTWETHPYFPVGLASLALVLRRLGEESVSAHLTFPRDVMVFQAEVVADLPEEALRILKVHLMWLQLVPSFCAMWALQPLCPPFFAAFAYTLAE